jgi:hypothetical protein
VLVVLGTLTALTGSGTHAAHATATSGTTTTGTRGSSARTGTRTETTGPGPATCAHAGSGTTSPSSRTTDATGATARTRACPSTRAETGREPETCSAAGSSATRRATTGQTSAGETTTRRIRPSSTGSGRTAPTRVSTAGVATTGDSTTGHAATGVAATTCAGASSGPAGNVAAVAHAATPVGAAGRRNRRRVRSRAVRSGVLRHLRVDLRQGWAVDTAHRLLSSLLGLLLLFHLRKSVDTAPTETERNRGRRGLTPAEPLRLRDELPRLTSSIPSRVEVVACHLDGIGAGLHPLGCRFADFSRSVSRLALPTIANDVGQVRTEPLATLAKTFSKLRPSLRHLGDSRLID